MRATLVLALLTAASTAAAKPPAESLHVAGKVTADPKVAKHVKAGGTVFVVVRAADADGNAIGMPIAVTKLRWTPRGVAFHLTDEDAMMGSLLAGDMVVIARFDQDGDATTRQAGDVEGHARVTVPVDGVTIVLDQLTP